MTKRSYMQAVIDGLRAVDIVEVAFLPSTMNTRNLINSLPNEVTYNQTLRKKIFVRLLLSIDRRETTAAAIETVCWFLLNIFLKFSLSLKAARFHFTPHDLIFSVF